MSQVRVSSSSLQSNWVWHSSPIFLPQAHSGTTRSRDSTAEAMRFTAPFYPVLPPRGQRDGSRHGPASFVHLPSGVAPDRSSGLPATGAKSKKSDGYTPVTPRGTDLTG